MGLVEPLLDGLDEPLDGDAYLPLTLLLLKPPQRIRHIAELLTTNGSLGQFASLLLHFTLLSLDFTYLMRYLILAIISLPYEVLYTLYHFNYFIMFILPYNYSAINSR